MRFAAAEIFLRRFAYFVAVIFEGEFGLSEKEIVHIDREVIMKNLAISDSWLLGFCGVRRNGNAQVSRQYAVHVPFDFTVGNKLLKAGDYWIGPLSGVTNQRTLFIQSRSTGKIGVIGQTAITSSESDKAGTMTFVKYGDPWVLEELTTPGFTLNSGTQGKR